MFSYNSFILHITSLFVDDLHYVCVCPFYILNLIFLFPFILNIFYYRRFIFHFFFGHCLLVLLLSSWYNCSLSHFCGSMN